MLPRRPRVAGHLDLLAKYTSIPLPIGLFDLGEISLPGPKSLVAPVHLQKLQLHGDRYDRTHLQACPCLSPHGSATVTRVSRGLVFCSRSASQTRAAMQLKYLALNDTLYRYACAQRTDANDPVLSALRTENALFGEDAKCQVSEEEGAFLSLLVSTTGTRSAIEVGTFTGYSSICIARGLPPGGRLICIDQSAKWTEIAQRYWAKAGVEQKIELRLGEALPLLRSLEPSLVFDFAFIDAAKVEYDAYFELILPHVRSNGLILLDNMLWAGKLTGNLDNDPRSEERRVGKECRSRWS